MDTPAKRLLRPERVEERYDIGVGYLAKLRCSGDGPVFLKINSMIFYEPEAMERWLDTKRRTSTSDTGEALVSESDDAHVEAAGRRRERHGHADV